MVTTQFRVRRGALRQAQDEREDNQRMVIPDLVLFVNGIPLVVMEAKSPTLMDVWKAQTVRQLLRYQEAVPQWHGTGAPENIYFEWKSVLPYSEDEVRQRFGIEPQGQSELIAGLLSPSTLMDIKQFLPQVVPFQQLAEVQDRTRIGYRLRQPQPHEAPHRLRLIQQVFHGRVAQVVAELDNVDPQHHRQVIRPTPRPALG